MLKRWLAILTLLFIFLIGVSPTYATRGCCSWHEGVCGNSCCDGTPLSAKCGGGSYTDNSNYYTPQVYIPKAPNIFARFSYTPNEDGAFDIDMDWDDVESTGYSISLEKLAPIDPGPKTDTIQSQYIFTDVKPGLHYFNMKVGVNGAWSNILYWKIETPTGIPQIQRKPHRQPLNLQQALSVDPMIRLLINTGFSY